MNISPPFSIMRISQYFCRQEARYSFTVPATAAIGPTLNTADLVHISFIISGKEGFIPIGERLFKKDGSLLMQALRISYIFFRGFSILLLMFLLLLIKISV